VATGVSPACKHSFRFYQRFLSVSLSGYVQSTECHRQNPAFASWDYSHYPPPQDGAVGDWCIATLWLSWRYPCYLQLDWCCTICLGFWHGDAACTPLTAEPLRKRSKKPRFISLQAILQRRHLNGKVSPPPCLRSQFRPPAVVVSPFDPSYHWRQLVRLADRGQGEETGASCETEGNTK